MYNLSNLNDYEFELLSKDIMERKLNTKLHTFAKGKDGGIDVCDSEVPMKVMIQVKHYIGSTFNNLKNTLINEVKKVKQHNPSDYYLFCSLKNNLTRDNKLEILNIFKGCNMKNISHIIDNTEINDFLSNEENKDIVEKNFKLWLCSTNVLSLINNQNVFIDCNEILRDIEEETSLFVETKSYIDCLKKLNDDNIIIITGEPGVGKSTISKMLLLKYAYNGYTVRYASNNNVSTIKNVMSRNTEVKEILLLDDFLGQHYLKINDTQPNEIKYLISFIERNPNKKLILNTRIHILNQAQKTSIDFNKLLEDKCNNKYLIDINDISDFDKAKIFYNHLYFNNIPPQYMNSIKRNKNYLNIINHKNYNPRIIEYVTRKNNYENTNADNYYNYIKSKLDNPDSVWEDDFKNRLDNIDRIFMNTLYSLTDTTIEINILQESFNYRLFSYDEYKSKTSIDFFNDTLNRLNNALIKIIFDKDKYLISVLNPSINDYMKCSIQKNSAEQIEIINNSLYAEQLLKVMKSSLSIDRVNKMIIDKTFLNLKTKESNIEYYFLDVIFKNSIYDISIKSLVKESFKVAYKKCFSWKYNDLISNLVCNNFFDYYELFVYLSDSDLLEDILSYMLFEDIIMLFNYNKTKNKNLENNDELINIYESALYDKILDVILDNINDNLSNIVEEVISDNKIEPPEDEIEEKNDLNDYYVDNYSQLVYDYIDIEIDNNYESLIKTLPSCITINRNSIDRNFIIYNLDVDKTIISVIEGKKIDEEVNNYLDNYEFYHTDKDNNEIDEMFR